MKSDGVVVDSENAAWQQFFVARRGENRSGVGFGAVPKPLVASDNMSLRRRPLKKSAASGQVV